VLLLASTQATCSYETLVQIGSPPLVTITVTHSAAVRSGDTTTLQAQPFENGVAFTSPIWWSVDNPALLEVDSATGRARAGFALGRVEVTAHLESPFLQLPSIDTTIALTITPGRIRSSADLSGIVIASLGGQATFADSVTDISGVHLLSGADSFLAVSADPNVLEVVGPIAGKVTLIGKVASATTSVLLRARADATVQDSVHVRLMQVVKSLTLQPDTLLLDVGDTGVIVASADDSGGTSVANATIQWRASDTNTVRVSSTGTVRGLAPGVTTVTGTVDQVSAAAYVTVRDTTAGTLVADDFGAGLGKWIVRGDTIHEDWTTQNGELIGEYDIGCGAPTCEQGDLLLRDSLQPGAINWEADVEFSTIADSVNPAYNLVYADAYWSLWVSDTEQVQLGVGWAVNNVPMPTMLDSAQWTIASYPWSQLAGGVMPVPSWQPAAWNTASLVKTGQEYALYLNGSLVSTYTSTLSALPKLGFHVYGRIRLSHFILKSL